MKILPKLEKGQFPAGQKWGLPVTNAEWRKNSHVAAGYKNYTCMLVGAAGGPSGVVTGDSDTSAGAAGGGGGAMIAFSGLLADLPDVCLLTVGTRGTTGVSVGNHSTAGNGGLGGSSIFQAGADIWEATGGEGGIQGRVEVNSGIATWDRRGRGGNGGIAIEPSGSFAAVGGLGGGDVPGSAVNDIPTDGGYQQAGTLWLPGTVVGGGGGGAGAPRIYINGSTPYASQNGADSAGGVGGLGAAYAQDGGVKTTSNGGAGAGINIQPFYGSLEVRGSHASGAIPDGVVLLVLS